MTAKEIHQALASGGMRLFHVQISISGRFEEIIFIHNDRTVAAWRGGVSNIISSSIRVNDSEEMDDEVFNDFLTHMRRLGYIQAMDVCSDCFEGKVFVTEAKLVHDPDHEEQVDGFGHWGWESKLI